MRNENSLVSMITPSYTQGRFIEEIIVLVKNQDYGYSNVERITVDRQSRDNNDESYTL